MRPDLEDLDQEIAQVRREKEAAVDRQDSEAATALRDKEKQLLADRARPGEGVGGVRCWPQDAGQGTGPAEAELERLRAILREHGIEPGDDAHRRPRDRHSLAAAINPGGSHVAR